jgi:hypothetical protein
MEVQDSKPVHQLFIDFEKAYDLQEKYCTEFSLDFVYTLN